MRDGLIQGFSLGGDDERKVVMRREPFLELVRAAMDSLPRKFRRHIQNVAVVVEDRAPEGRDPNDLLMGVFEGTPRTKQGFFGADTGPKRRWKTYSANLPMEKRPGTCCWPFAFSRGGGSFKPRRKHFLAIGLQLPVAGGPPKIASLFC